MTGNPSFVEIGDSAPNFIDKYSGLVVLNSFNEGVLSKISKNKNITVLIRLDDLISKNGIEKSKELNRIRRLADFLMKYSIKFVFESKERTKDEISIIGTLFGLSYGQSKIIANRD